MHPVRHVKEHANPVDEKITRKPKHNHRLLHTASIHTLAHNPFAQLAFLHLIAERRMQGHLRLRGLLQPRRACYLKSFWRSNNDIPTGPLIGNLSMDNSKAVSTIICADFRSSSSSSSSSSHHFLMLALNLSSLVELVYNRDPVRSLLCRLRNYVPSQWPKQSVQFRVAISRNASARYNLPPGYWVEYPV